MIAPLLLSTLLMAVTATPGGPQSTVPASTHSFSRYQIILDRSPFSPPAGSVEVPQPNFATRYGYVGWHQESETAPLTAMIQDKEANRIYFKGEGETIGSVSIISVNKSPGAKILIKQGLETATLTLESKAGVGPAPSPPPGIQSPGSPQPGQPNPAVQPGTVRRIPFRRGD